MIDGLMFSYILLHLFIFLNISLHQGGGYDMRFYLPLHLPFLYFSIVATENLIAKRFWDIMKAYFASILILFPVFIWAFWITGYKKIFYLTKFSRIFGDVLLILLFISSILCILANKKEKHKGIFDQIFSSFFGISMFLGTWILSIITIVYSRGLYKAYTESGMNFTMVLPVIKMLQEILQNILR